MEDKIGEFIGIIMNNKFTLAVSILSAWLIVFYILLFVDKATCDKMSKIANMIIIVSCLIILMKIIIMRLGGI